MIVTATMEDSTAVITWDPDKPDWLGIWVPGKTDAEQFPTYVVGAGLITAMRATAQDGQPRQAGALLVERSNSHE